MCHYLIVCIVYIGLAGESDSLSLAWPTSVAMVVVPWAAIATSLVCG
jgi:hypothetical protein